MDVRLTRRVVEIFHEHRRVASHVRRLQRSGHVTVAAHMPKTHQHYANTTPASLVERTGRIGVNTATLVERLMRERRHPQQRYRAAMRILSLSPRYGRERLEAACARAPNIKALSYSSVNAILKFGLDRADLMAEPAKPTPAHKNIRGSAYYQ
ncbi:transposase [Stappia aggregata IAM 12614]|uniref:Transposase n=1 Tax=Roseibium aggregatum (strain ATCC 25650 / DSM 13394 / JCM 20685 / NBRC 16684 / NCIMB 2208 / IAM 12614 / B1) TaxID=384765 RepID=A0P480_ROSAI|nr:transposase [Stappia aggregata IAM 12614] [Roseibium aggregatum IAM 12614]